MADEGGNLAPPSDESDVEKETFQQERQYFTDVFCSENNKHRESGSYRNEAEKNKEDHMVFEFSSSENGKKVIEKNVDAEEDLLEETPDSKVTSGEANDLKAGCCRDEKLCFISMNEKGENTMRNQHILCHTCLRRNMETEAVECCLFCENPKPLCKSCIQLHNHEQVTNAHEKYDVKLPRSNLEQTDVQILCDPCHRGNVNSGATGFCKTCKDPEPLCQVCAQLHTRQKASKDHEISNDMALLCYTQRSSDEEINQQSDAQILCDPCLLGKIDAEAMGFCKTCNDPEPLCRVCAQLHTRQKATRDHEICNDMTQLCNPHRTSEKGQNVTCGKQTLCDSCNCANIQTEATHFCKTCEDPEPMCDVCAQYHTRQKATKDHEICNDMDQFCNADKKTEKERNAQHDKQIFCDPCLLGNVKTEATRFCKTCIDPEPLCEVCAQLHTRQKATKGHEICDDIAQCSNYQTTFSQDRESKEIDKRIFCDPCRLGNIKTEATRFCKTCIDPEPFCEVCAQMHIRQKATKGHEICDDMKDFFNFQKKLKENHQRGNKMFCYSCNLANIQTGATHFCKTCKDPEPLCDVCAQYHTRQKATKDHEVCNDIGQLNNPEENTDMEKVEIAQYHKPFFCDPCLLGSVKTEATRFCKTCMDPEPLCEVCAQQHTRQRATKGHDICDDIAQFYCRISNQCENEHHEKQILCEICIYAKVETEATCFCKTCKEPDPLCDVCAQYHTRQKATRDHEICNDLGQYSFYKETLNRGDEQQNKEKECCELCHFAKKISEATGFCETCDDPELLCETCAQQHTRQRATRGHKICYDFSRFPKPPMKSDKNYFSKKIGLTDEKAPGKPTAKDVKSGSVELLWEKPRKQVDHFQVRFKLENGDAKWRFAETNVETNCTTVTGLMAHTKYIFQVRGVYGDEEGPYGPVSNVIETQESSATTFLEFCVRLSQTSPSKYLLPVQEKKAARNTNARTRQLYLGTPINRDCDEKEKTIMLVGATGSGKSTLVDGIVNYILGVGFEDPFRFTMVTLENEEKKNDNQAHSQTEWITVYRIYPTKGGRLNYTLNIIDTPGFGDTRGIERDSAIVEQIRHLFSAKGDQGVLYIDAVCFIVKAPDARLTVVQKYIFGSIMSLFGKDIESNICTLITFADGATPPVLASLKESKLPFGQKFDFNNSALFAENNDDTHNTLSPMFWEMGCRSFEDFFEYIIKLETKSLSQTKNVLDEREQLKTIISSIRPQVTAGLSKLSELRQQLDIFERYKNEIKDNQNFQYTVDETRQEMIDLPKGEHVTNCLQCNVTCHEKCKIADDNKKIECWAMDDEGKCRVCSGKCIWSHHKNTPYIFKYVTETVTKTYAEMKERYEDAAGRKLTHEKYIKELTYDVDELFDDILALMNEMNHCKTRLKEIALRPDPLSAVEHIDLMIQGEKNEKQPGYFNRIQMLEEMKRMALVDKDVEMFEKNIKDTRQNVQSVVGSSFKTAIKVKPKRPGNVFSRGFQYVKKMF